METKDIETFKTRVRRKIAGWYSNPEFEDKAVDRIATQREEIIALLKSTERDGIDEVLRYLDDSGFYYRASSPNKQILFLLWLLMEAQFTSMHI